MTLKYAVFGHPISHSLSPEIHSAFARQLGIDLSYVAIDASVEALPDALAAFAADGGQGANLTLPLKQAGLALCGAGVSERARRAGAVNTVVRRGDGWWGDNTDGIGLVRDLTARHLLHIRGRRTLLLGAGGAAHGVAPALLDAGIAELVIVNRTAERADQLADTLGEPARAHSRYWDDLGALGTFELIVNATSAGRSATLELPGALVNSLSAAVDLSYGEVAIPFLAWARASGCGHAFDGLGMLVEQAAESFELWHGKRPDTDEVHALLIARHDKLATGD
jgi:shikimate dehydrogenase